MVVRIIFGLRHIRLCFTIAFASVAVACAASCSQHDAQKSQSTGDIQSSASSGDRELANVAAFAKLYGVARWFHPGDAAAAIDWDRFAVWGTSRVRTAANDEALRAALTEVFAPILVDMKLGGTDESAAMVEESASAAIGPSVSWQHEGLGVGTSGGGGAYRSRRTNRLGDDDYGFAMQQRAASDLRGRRVRLSSMARGNAGSPEATAFIWMTATDGNNRSVGGLDSTKDRVATQRWQRLRIELDVPRIAESLWFGIGLSRSGRAEFDSVALDVKGSDGQWRALDVEDASFEQHDDWSPGTANGRYRVEYVADETAPDATTIASISRGTRSGTPLFRTRAKPGAAATFPLTSDITATVPTWLPEERAVVNDQHHARLAALRSALDALPPELDTDDASVRLADVAIAWNVFRHFAPNLPASEVDWDAQLLPLLAMARSGDGSRRQQRDVLRKLAALTRDGHAFVRERAGTELRFLPIHVRPLAGHLVVTYSDAPDVRAGDVIRGIDGESAESWFARERALAAGSDAYREWVSVGELVRGPPDSKVSLELDRGAARVEVTLERTGEIGLADRSGAAVRVVEEDIWYVDLQRASYEEIEPRLETLSKAAGIVFDMRGYPSDLGWRLLPHFIASAESALWLHSPRYVEPFGKVAEWHDAGWKLSPRRPLLRGNVAFLADGRAASAAETILGYVEAHEPGPIVGSRSAGVNGNANLIGLPSGFRIGFTGMVVTAHDGKSPHFLVGIEPDVYVEPSVAGIRAGKDEVLERAVQLLRVSGGK